jgi:hypothetical protein
MFLSERDELLGHKLSELEEGADFFSSSIYSPLHHSSKHLVVYKLAPDSHRLYGVQMEDHLKDPRSAAPCRYYCHLRMRKLKSNEDLPTKWQH